MVLEENHYADESQRSLLAVRVISYRCGTKRMICAGFLKLYTINEVKLASEY